MLSVNVGMQGVNNKLFFGVLTLCRATVLNETLLSHLIVVSALKVGIMKILDL